MRIKLEHFNRIVRGQLDGADLALDLITPTAEREKALDFSAPYLDAAPTVLCAAGSPCPTSTPPSGCGGVRCAARRLSTSSLADHSRPTATSDPDNPTMLHALESNQIDAVLFDMPLAVATAGRSGGRLDAAAQLPDPETIAAALPSGSSNVPAVDSAMRAFTSDGKIDHLLKIWVGSDAANAQSSIPLLHTLRDRPGRAADLDRGNHRQLPYGAGLAVPGPVRRRDHRATAAPARASAGDHRTAPRRLRDRPPRPQSDRRRQHHVPDLGQVGLLYLMFVAGVELDLALLRVHRRAVITSR